MKSIKKILALTLAVLMATLIFTACTNSTDEQYKRIFGNTPDKLKPTVGNDSYKNNSLFPVQTQEGGDNLPSQTTAAPDDDGEELEGCA